MLTSTQALCAAPSVRRKRDVLCPKAPNSTSAQRAPGALARGRLARASATRRTPPPPPPLPGPPLPLPEGLHPSALVDALCAACCVALLATSAARRRAANQHEQQQQQQQVQQGQQRRDSGRAAVVAAPAPPPLPATSLFDTPGLAGEAVVACVLMSAVSNLLFKTSRPAGGASLGSARSAGSASGGGGGGGAAVAAEAAARLARLEAVTDKQMAEFSAALRQIDKLQVRGVSVWMLMYLC